MYPVDETDHRCSVFVRNYQVNYLKVKEVHELFGTKLPSIINIARREDAIGVNC